MTKTLTEQWREGTRFGKITILGFHHKDKHYHRYYECVCDCGKKTIVNESNLKRWLTKSCGCGIVEALVWRNKNIKQKDKHKYKDYSLYPLWKSIRSRCLCKTEPAYKDYGGRGICICDEWGFLSSLNEDGYCPRCAIVHCEEKIKKLQEQLAEANRLIKWVVRTSWSGNQEEDDFDRYIDKWGVK